MQVSSFRFQVSNLIPPPSAPLRLCAKPAFLFCILLLASCQPTAPAQPKSPAGLPLTTLDVAGSPLQTEIANTPSAMQRGLMFRKELPENAGMLFIFAQPQPASFWMRNTYLPLSIAYIAPDGTILEIHDMQPLDETPVRSEAANVKYALEVNQGWFVRHRIPPGAKVGNLPR